VQERLPEGDEYRHMPMRRTQRQSPDAFKNFEDAIYPRARAAADWGSIDCPETFEKPAENAS